MRASCHFDRFKDLFLIFAIFAILFDHLWSELTLRQGLQIKNRAGQNFIIQNGIGFARGAKCTKILQRHAH